MGAGWRRLERRGVSLMATITVNINVCRLLAVYVDLRALTINVQYVCCNLTNGVYTDHPALTSAGKASYPLANGLSQAQIKAAIQAVEPNIDFAGGDQLKV